MSKDVAWVWIDRDEGGDWWLPLAVPRRIIRGSFSLPESEVASEVTTAQLASTPRGAEPAEQFDPFAATTPADWELFYATPEMWADLPGAIGEVGEDGDREVMA